MKKKFLLILIMTSIFSVISYTQTANITVTNPYSGQTWYKGEACIISWTKRGSMDSQVKITLYKPDHTTLQAIIVRPTANDGSYSWTIPDSIPNGQYIVRVKTMDNAVYDDSDVFTIAAAPVHPANIVVISPRLGDSWCKGKSYKIVWKHRGSMDSQVKITLYKPDHTTLQTVIVRPTANDGSYIWRISDSIPNGQYIVRVKTMDNAVYDDGDIFQIKTCFFKSPLEKAPVTSQKVSPSISNSFLPDFEILNIKIPGFALGAHGFSDKLKKISVLIKNNGYDFDSLKSGGLVKFRVIGLDRFPEAGKYSFSKDVVKSFSIRKGETKEITLLYKNEIPSWPEDLCKIVFAVKINSDKKVKEKVYSNNFKEKPFYRGNVKWGESCNIIFDTSKIKIGKANLRSVKDRKWKGILPSDKVNIFMFAKNCCSKSNSTSLVISYDYWERGYRKSKELWRSHLSLEPGESKGFILTNVKIPLTDDYIRLDFKKCWGRSCVVFYSFYVKVDH